MLSQLFILSPRGDCLISRDFLGDVPRGASEVFLRQVRVWGQQQQQDAAAAEAAAAAAAAAAAGTTVSSDGDSTSLCALSPSSSSAAAAAAAAAASTVAPPIFSAGGVSFAHINRNNLFFVAATQQNVSPALLIEILLKLVKAIKVNPKP